MKIGHDNPDCIKQRSCANVAGTLSGSTTTPTADTHRIEQTPSLGKPQQQIKICYRCKQPGHVHNDCIVDHQGVVHHSTPISNAELLSTCSTPTVVGERDVDDFKSPQLVAVQGRTTLVVVLSAAKQVGGVEFVSCHTKYNVVHEQQSHVQQQPGVEKQLDVQQQLTLNVINQAPIINLLEAYTIYKEGQNVLKRPLHDENNLTESDSKKQHVHISLSIEENQEEEGKI
ncbi:unnamed protein product [Rotaria sp. Silwood2]|nr:unnamed protein product [Rotaria sp. Silwood2]CAF4408887.1 unnamed protein product [Rotaria sp. Silwood2]